MSEEPVDILIVDDSPVKLLALDSALTPLGVRLHKAASGREALRLMLTHDFAVVLLDVNMPGMDGFETAELIRGRDRSAYTPIIFISAIDQSEAHTARGYRLGAVDYVFSPILPEVIRAKVAVFVELHRKTLEAILQAEKIASDAYELAVSSERLRHAERLASLGTLAAGLGHDMGNLLLPVRCHLESIRNQDVPAAVLEDVSAVLKCAEYLQRLAHGLRMLSLDGQDDGATPNQTDLQRWWTSFSPVLRGCLPRGTVLESQLEGPLPRVLIPEHNLSQVVFNLVQNAGDALRHQEAGWVRVWAEPGGDGAIRLGITDNGPGMSEDVRRRCFEPFFTTKTRSMSTGLGLSLVRTLIAKAGGALHVESQVGVGTTFILTLPCARAQAGSPGRAVRASPVPAVIVAEPAGPPLERPIKVLCVDDNELIAEAIRRRLRRETDFEWVGWLPSASTLARTAEKECPDVVLLDVDIPGDDTFQSLKDLTVVHPAVRVLMLSGHSCRDYVDLAMASGASGYLLKSDETDTIINAMRQVVRGEVVLNPELLTEDRRSPREGEPERRPAAGPGLNPDRPAVAVEDASGDREPRADAVAELAAANVKKRTGDIEAEKKTLKNAKESVEKPTGDS